MVAAQNGKTAVEPLHGIARRLAERGCVSAWRSPLPSSSASSLTGAATVDDVLAELRASSAIRVG